MGEGELYIRTTDGYEPLMKLENLSIETIESPREYADDQVCIPWPITFDPIEIPIKLSKEALNELFGIRRYVYDCCSNKKVVYLAKHARKRKTRKKNLNRAIRILEREDK